MPTLNGLVEPDILVNGHALSFAEAMSVRVAISSMRLSLHDADTRAGIGDELSKNYDHHLARVERLMLSRP